jgi:hypothetical protein
MRASSCRSFIASLAAIAAVSLASGPVMAQTGSGYRVDQGIAIYYATIPAAIIRGHPAQHPEATMHGGVPRSPHAYHLMVAVFDAASLQRITDAEVNARVTEIGLAGEEKKLEKFAVADAITYGNYFEIRPNTLYRTSLWVKRPASNREAHVEFQFRHD